MTPTSESCGKELSWAREGNNPENEKAVKFNNKNSKKSKAKKENQALLGKFILLIFMNSLSIQAIQGETRFLPPIIAPQALLKILHHRVKQSQSPFISQTKEDESQIP